MACSVAQATILEQQTRITRELLLFDARLVFAWRNKARDDEHELDYVEFFNTVGCNGSRGLASGVNTGTTISASVDGATGMANRTVQ